MVERRQYLDKLIKLRNKQIIKVVTGVRRCGKSTLLLQFQEYLRGEGVEERQIIYLNFEKIGTILGKHCGTVESTRKSCFPQKAYELAKRV